MLACHCPQCGAPSPVSLAMPDHMRCDHCRYQGPPPEHVRHNLHAAAHALGTVEDRRRQLSGLQRRTLGRAGTAVGCYFGLLAVVVIPFLGIALALGSLHEKLQTWAIVLFGLTPFALILATGLVAGWQLRRARRQVIDACGALPPRSPGEPARCHVCGADLVAAASEGVARCGYCRADNVVSSDAIERRRSRSQTVLDAYEHAVRGEAAVLGSAATRARNIVVLAALVAPAGVLVVGASAAAAMSATAGPADQTEYVLWKTADGPKCLAGITKDANGVETLDFGREVPEGAAARFRPTTLENVPRSRAADLVGRTVYARGVTGKVTGAVKIDFDETDNYFRVVLEGEKKSYDQAVRGTCIVDDERPPRRIAEVGTFGRRLAADASHVYVATQSGLERVPLAGGESETLSRMPDDIHAIAVDDAHVYAALARGLYRLQKDPDAKPAEVADVGKDALDLGVDDTHAYWVDEGGVHRISKEGGEAERLLAGKRIAIALDGEHLYVLGETGELERLAKTGGDARSYPSLVRPAGALAVRQGTVYWTRAKGGSGATFAVLERSLEGEAATSVAPGVDEPEDLVVAGGALVWLDAKRGWLVRRAP